MNKATYTKEFKEQAIRKANERGNQTIASIAKDLNMPFYTLKEWLKERSNSERGFSHGAPPLPGNLSAREWGPEQRLQALLESHTLSGPELHAWCRERGLFEHQLQEWRKAFCVRQPTASQERSALRELKAKNDQLAREIRRKDKALAETAALLVLQKKFQALLEDEEK